METLACYGILFLSLGDLIKELPAWLVELSEAVTWPVSVLIIFWVTRHKVRGLIDKINEQIPRIRQVGVLKLDSSNQQYSTEVEPGKIAEDVLANSSADKNAAYDPLVHFSQLTTMDELSPVFKSFEESLAKNSNVPDKDKKTHALYSAAVFYIILEHERSYRLIYESQIKLLREMRDFKVTTRTGAMPFYEEAVQNYPEAYKDYPFGRWLIFLSNRNLISVSGEEIKLTPYGIGFIQFIDRSNLPKKAF